MTRRGSIFLRGSMALALALWPPGGPAPTRAEPPNCSALGTELEAKEFEVRARAATQIGIHCRSGAFVPGLEKLLQDQASTVRQAAAGALAQISEVSAKKALQLAVGNPSPKQRRDYIVGLAEAPDRHLDLLDGALSDEDQLVRERAVLALGEGTSGAVLLHLAKALQRDVDVFVRERAVESIRGWYARAREGGRQASVPREVFAALRAGLADQSDRVRVQTIQTLAVVDPEGAVAQLGSLLRDRSASVRRAVFDVLGKLGGPRSITLLEEAVADEELSIRRMAVSALVALGPPGLQGVLTATRDPVLEIRSDALEGLPRPLPPAAVPAVVRLANDEAESIRRRAVEALGTVPGDPTAQQGILAALSDSNPTVRRVGVETAARVFGDAVVDHLETMVLVERDLVVGRVTLEVIAGVETSDAANLLGEVLASTSAGDFGEEALRLLLERQRRFAGGPLMRALPHVDASLKRNIVNALGELGDARVAPELLLLFEDEEVSDHLRIDAALALAALGHEPALPAIQDLYVEGVHLSDDSLRDLQEAMSKLGAPEVWPLLLRRHRLKLGVALLFVVGLLVWHFLLRPRVAAAEAARQEAYLERRAKEAPKGPPTEDEFLVQLDEKLAGTPPRSREVKLLLQRGMLHFIRLDYDQAVTDLEEAVRKFTDDDSSEHRALAHFFLGKASIKRGDNQYAQRQFSQALRHHDSRINQEVMSEIAQHQGPSDLEKNIRLLEEKLPFTDDISSVDVYKLS